MSSSFNFPRPTTKTDDLEDLYKTYGVDRAVVLDLASTNETPETVREGYYGAYLSFFYSCGLIFPIPEPIYEILAELGLSFTQIPQNFLSRTLVPSLCLRAQVATSSRTSPIATRSGANIFRFQYGSSICGGIRLLSASSELGRESRGRSTRSTFDQTRIRAVFAMPDGTNRAPLVGGSEDEAEHSQEVITTPSVQAHSSDRLTRQLVRRSSFRTFGSASRGRASRKCPLILIHDSDDEDASGELRSPVSEDETIAATRKRRRSSKVALPGPSPPRFVPEGDGSLFPAQGDLISLAGRMRYAGCGLRSLASSAEKEAYAKVAVASSKMMEAFNEYVVVMEDHGMASRNDKEIDSIGSDIRRLSKEFEATKREGKKDAEKIEALTKDSRRIHHENEALMTQMVPQKVRIAALEVVRDRDIRRASRVARRDFATRYREILESLKDKWTSKKKEVSSEIQLQEVIANIDLLNEFKDGGLTVDAELARLKEMEGDCEDLVASAAVPDWSISELDLPKVSDDSVDQVGGSSVLDDSASS
ncbi:hypothetical protein F2Q70_00029941 [Brassica cretica]|uniref:Uncharacterized protein n=2 Tax=Brassica TaxID=3705 RepID=A0A8S9FFF4_BRACR|nr:hypothetical protein F2Q70_00029941 [Brassica cretica]KAF3486111.1 hypothetical protein F2Q69_00053206 [Brassica cretica]